MIDPSDRYLTISVDDGHPADLRTADLLARFDIAVTLDVPAVNPERPPFPCGVSTQAYLHSTRVQHRCALVEGDPRRCVGVRLGVPCATRLVRPLLASCGTRQPLWGVARLYLRSWEIGPNDDRAALERTRRNAAGRPAFRDVDNGTLFRAPSNVNQRVLRVPRRGVALA